MPKTKLGRKLEKSSTRRKPKNTKPVWKGPEKDGITQSLLSRWLVCRERFRLLVVEGLKPVDQFNHRIEYGNMWHLCEEAFAPHPLTDDWSLALGRYCRTLAQKYRTSGSQVEHWFNVCRTQFPIYTRHWSKHSDVKQRTPLLQEQVFNVPYQLPSGRMVRLRGKWDGVDLIGNGRNAGIYLRENKTKGDVKEGIIVRQLQFDLQTMFYLVALDKFRLHRYDTDLIDCFAKLPLGGVIYNVVRRPLSGGKGSIVQHKPTKGNPDGESSEEFYSRLGEVMKADPDYFFMRWKVEITPADVERFKRECLDPILEQLCDWWDYIRNGFVSHLWTSNEVRGYPVRHWRHPFGVYNVLNEGGVSELDEYLATGSKLGLETTSNLFPELE